MWFLTGPKGELIYLKRNSKIVVGRTQGDIILRDDKSVSRNHASVTIQSTGDGPKSWCFVKDLDSKYGSSVIRGDTKLKVTKEGIIVHHNDKIKFGLQNNDYIASHIPIMVLVSSMNDTRNLQKIVKDLDGCIVHEWTKQVTHLTTPKAKLGEKIALALVNCVPIVGMEYWEAVRNAVENNREWPKYAEYILPISEDIIDNTKVSLRPNPDRKTLFSNLTFLFFSFSQLEIYKEIIRAAGGRVLMFDASIHNNLTQFCSDEYIVIYYMIGSSQTEESILDSQGSRTCYEQIEELLRKKKRRMISDSEITLAVLHCSLKQNCNPNYVYKKLLFEKVKNDSDDDDKKAIIALDTQDLRSKLASLPSSENIIAETNEFMSQKFKESQEDTQYSNVNSKVESCTPSLKPEDISSIRIDSQESTGDIETDFKLNMYAKRSEKRGPDFLTSTPAKKVKLNSGSSLFPVLSKNKSQEKCSQNLQSSQRLLSLKNSQDLQNSQNSQISSKSDISVLLSQRSQQMTLQKQSKFLQPSTSDGLKKEAEKRSAKNIFSNWMKDSKENEKEIDEEMRPQLEKRSKNNEETETHVEKSKEKYMGGRKEIDLKAKINESKADESIIWCEPEAKKKQIEPRNDSSSKVFNVLTERNDKRKRDSGDGDSDINNIEMQKKQKRRIESISTAQTELSAQSTDGEDQNCILVTGLIREEFHDSLLERTYGRKTFHKFYDMIPRRRVKLDSMTICGQDNDENAE